MSSRPSHHSRRLTGPADGTNTPNRPHPNAPYHPPADTSTYRDLLLFEERLKSNAEMLRRRRQRYNVFLWSFVAALILMGYRLAFLPPQNLFKMRALQASVAVVFITLALFFASGMYEEKIRYATSYINHSNRALRPLNMHLNMRRARPSFLAYVPFLPPSLRPAPPAVPTSTAGMSKPAPPTRSNPLLPPSVTVNNSRRASGTPPTVMPSIPASTNPRGELIFSSRVDRSFREGYERYRAAFERRREEKAREEARTYGRGGWLSWATRRGGRSRKGSPSPETGGISISRTVTPTPPVSRRDTPPLPPPGQQQSNLSAEGAGRRTPSPASALRNIIDEKERRAGAGAGAGGSRERAESYSFVWTGPAGADTAPRRAP
ncbi:hypothetical protein CI109_104980 [Kwoniella shandongensis]|uniref:Transmembrane protein 188 n=1 Tax=Kwoniella shandongensis TaxID=1734106 RepID=A0A5M6BS62_9TREE|nr:uncharacterized protein CI109_006695 [Kwoniella shandongensis]KAA5524971.1 hypothetical protein CI109_006695 [Kwoniella shandongensis]